MARFYETEPRLLIVQPDLALRVYLNGQSQPGDPYGSGRMRVGLKTQVGENILVIYAYGGRGNPKGKLWISPDEVFFNQRDRTFPDLRAEDSSTSFLGIQVAFGADSNITDLVARVVESEHFESSTIRYPHIHPGASTQIGFNCVQKRLSPLLEKKYQFDYDSNLSTSNVPTNLKLGSQRHQQTLNIERALDQMLTIQFNIMVSCRHLTSHPIKNTVWFSRFTVQALKRSDKHALTPKRIGLTLWLQQTDAPSDSTGRNGAT